MSIPFSIFICVIAVLVARTAWNRSRFDSICCLGAGIAQLIIVLGSRFIQ